MTTTCSTPRFGPIQYADADVITLEHGVVPFHAARRFVLVRVEDEDPFAWLQSVDDPALAFVVAPLDLLFADHAERVRISLEQRDGEPVPATVAIYGIVVLNADPARMYMNLLAPIIIDFETMRGRQLVLDAPVELARQPLQAVLEALVMA